MAQERKTGVLTVRLAWDDPPYERATIHGMAIDALLNAGIVVTDDLGLKEEVPAERPSYNCEDPDCDERGNHPAHKDGRR